MKKKIRVVMVEPLKEPYVVEIEDTLEEIQRLVGGIFEEYHAFSPLVIVCNEEGKILGLPINRTVPGDILVGSFFITKHNGGSYISLTDKEIEKAIGLFTLKKADIQVTQPIMEKLFPRMKDYPMNSMTPSITLDEEGTVISMLIKGDAHIIQDFILDKSVNISVKTSIYTEKNEKNIGKDLVLKLDFFFKTGHPIFETVIYGDLLERQTEFIDALKKVNSMMVWVSDENGKVIRIIQVSYDNKLFEELLKNL